MPAGADRLLEGRHQGRPRVPEPAQALLHKGDSLHLSRQGAAVEDGVGPGHLLPVELPGHTIVFLDSDLVVQQGHQSGGVRRGKVDLEGGKLTDGVGDVSDHPGGVVIPGQKQVPLHPGMAKST